MQKVQYIGNYKHKSSFIKYTAIAGSCIFLGLSGFGLYYSLGRPQQGTSSQSQNTVAAAGSLDERLKGIISEIEQNPDYSNELARASLNSLRVNNAPIDQDVYVIMFEEIRLSAEDKPEIMDHFGENATAYMEKRFLEKYKFSVKDAVKDVAQTLKEKGKPLIDALGVKQHEVPK